MIRTPLVCLTVLACVTPPAIASAGLARYDSSARRLCLAERIQLGPQGFSRRYGGHRAMGACERAHRTIHQA